MRNLLIFLLLSPLALFATPFSSSLGEVEYASLIGGSGNLAEDFFLMLLIAGFLFLISQWIKYSGKMKLIKPLEVLPHLDEGEMVPAYKAEKLRLIPESFGEYTDDFELFWSLEAAGSQILGRIGFLHYNPLEKAIQLSFEISPEHAADAEIPILIEKACGYLWTEWNEEEIQLIQAYIHESDFVGEELLECLGFVESGNEGETIEFSSYRK